MGYRLKNAKFKYNSIGSWVIGDKQYLSQIITTDYDGKLPENSKEILVEQKYIDDNNLDWKIGDTVSLESGFRYLGDEFFRLPCYGKYRLSEGFDYTSTDSYKITGILHNNAPTCNAGHMLIRGADKNQSGTAYAYVKLKNVTPFSILEINSIINKFNFSPDDKKLNFGANGEYLQTKLAFDEYSDGIINYLPMLAAVLVLIIAASVVLIYNSFGMSLNERIRYLGMLSSVGATRKQKKMSVIYEALMLSLVGVPLGIIGGIGVVAALFAVLGERIKGFSLTGEAVTVLTVSLDVKPTLLIVAAAVLIGVGTVLISAIIPSKRASEISPVDAIRQSEEIKLRHRIRTPFFIRKIFGYEGELAYKNMRRNGAKARIIVASIALSLVLFLGCNYFCNLFIISTGLDDDRPYQVQVDFGAGPDGEVLADFREYADSNPDIKKYYSIMLQSISKNYGINEYFGIVEDLFNEKVLTDDYKELAYDESKQEITYYAIDDEDFNALCEKNGIDYKLFYDYEYGYLDYDEDVGYRTKKPIRVLLLNDYNRDADSPKPFNDSVIGAVQGELFNSESEDYIRMTLDIPDDEEINLTPEMKQTILELVETDSNRQMYQVYDMVDYDEDNYVFQLAPQNSVAAYYPISVENTKFEDYEDDEGPSCFLGIETDFHARLYEDLSEYFESKEINASVFDGEYWREQSMTRVIVLEVLIYGFIILISIITITNIINTIATSVNNRKKEFAMLRSVGITPKGFRKMLSFESLFYAIEGVLIGIPLSILVCYIINKSMEAVTIPFRMDIKLCVIAVAVIFAVIGMTMAYASSKVRGHGIIEELKMDIN